MILHLEAGTCESSTDLGIINQLAFECYQAEHYGSENRDFDFECPNCEVPFTFISGLLQHAENGHCDYLLKKKGALHIFLRFVTSRII
jgi:hypothetical protein